MELNEQLFEQVMLGDALAVRNFFRKASKYEAIMQVLAILRHNTEMTGVGNDYEDVEECVLGTIEDLEGLVRPGDCL